MMGSRKSEPPRFTRSQRYVIALFGLCVIASGIAALLAGKLYFHALPDRFLGWVFAPFALVVGLLLVLMALSLGKPR